MALFSSQLSFEKKNPNIHLNEIKLIILLFFHRQIGDAGVTCVCPNGFKGKKCQTPEDDDMNGK